MNAEAGTIVVGVDGSDSSLHALAWAAEQAAAERRPMTLVHAVGAVTPAYLHASLIPTRELIAQLRAEGQEVLDAARAKALSTSPDVEVREIFEFDDPRDLLLRMSEDAAMLVVGSRGRGTLRRLLLGSVGVALVRHSHCPVVVHRPAHAGAVRNGILVGADASAESSTVLEFAYREASLRRLPLTVLYCHWDVQAGTLGAYVDPHADTTRETQRVALAESVAGLAEKYPDVRATVEVADGRPQDVLVRLGERMNLVVVGAHQAGRAAEMVFGSVSRAVVEHARVPVAVVPVSTEVPDAA
jgi:nucleotide-binding universal stress UspA family protein